MKTLKHAAAAKTSLFVPQDPDRPIICDGGVRKSEHSARTTGALHLEVIADITVPAPTTRRYYTRIIRSSHVC